MPYRRVSFESVDWITRPYDEGEPAWRVIELSDLADKSL
jgi:hypothetical protein